MADFQAKGNEQERRLLHNRCNVILRELERLVEQYGQHLADCPNVVSQLRKAANRAREFQNGTFIVLVVGPVKSGKSTLVNLIANAYVSPTHFLECTVRPSIISQRRQGQDCRITVYTTNNNDQRVEQIDSIIDSLRGIDCQDSLQGINRSLFPLTPDNIKDKVELGLQESISAETLLTSITTPGGPLMKHDVFIIDMPGFDGEYANIDDPVYDTIAQRADLIIFVQSSNSAISKVSGLFLEKLHANNKDVPVCLIHNVFDSAHWRDNDERAAAVQEQKLFALGEIRRQGFKIDAEQCFSINLGKVEDARKEKYTADADLQREALLFSHVEKQLHDRVISNRDVMRLAACLGRVQQQVNRLAEAIAQECTRRADLQIRYHSAAIRFETISNTPFLAQQEWLPRVNPATLRAIVEGECQSRISQIQPRLHRSDSEARAIVVDFVRATERLLLAQLPDLLNIAALENQMFLQCMQRLSSIGDAMLQCGMARVDIMPNRVGLPRPAEVDLMAGIDLSMIVPHRTFIPGLRWWGHTSEDLVSYLNAAKARLVGAPVRAIERGYIETTALPNVMERMNESVGILREHYINICNDHLRECKRLVLDTIIPDIEPFNYVTEDLKKLQSDVNNIKF